MPPCFLGRTRPDAPDGEGEAARGLPGSPGGHMLRGMSPVAPASRRLPAPARRRRLTRPLSSVLLPALVLGAAAVDVRGLDLVRQGRPACTIVTAEHPTPSARLAALEIRSHLLAISGADIPIRSERDPAEGVRILVGDSEATQRLGLRGDAFAPQEYLIAFQSNTVVLLGRDWKDTEANRNVPGYGTSGGTLQEIRHRVDYGQAVGRPELATGEIELPGLYDDQGTCLAAYDFLERHCGVRWYGPAPQNVVVPSSPDVAVAGEDRRRSPALKHRSGLPAGNWPFLRRQWGAFDAGQVHLYWRRIRQGGERWAGNHTFHRETIRSTFTNAVYQCQNPRGVGSQLCYTHPELIRQVARMARDFFDGKPGLPAGWRAMGDYFAIVPDDNMNLCSCASCTALLEPGLARKSGQFASGEMSDYWFTFVNAVAREVRQTHPGRYIATLAYWAYSAPPGFALEPNVSVAPCLQTCYFPVHTGIRDHELRWFEDWRSRTTAPMFLWVYYHHPMEPALIDRWKCFPHVTVHQTALRMQSFLRAGVRGIFECGEQDQVEQYVMARIWDDPDLDVHALIDEFFRLYFGPAAEPMQRFYTRLEEIACDPANYPAPYMRDAGIDWRGAAWERLGTAERMKELGKLIDDAGRLAESPLHQNRVSHWRAALWDWMVEGRTQHLRQPSRGGP